MDLRVLAEYINSFLVSVVSQKYTYVSLTVEKLAVNM